MMAKIKISFDRSTFDRRSTDVFFLPRQKQRGDKRLQRNTECYTNAMESMIRCPFFLKQLKFCTYISENMYHARVSYVCNLTEIIFQSFPMLLYMARTHFKTGDIFSGRVIHPKLGVRYTIRPISSTRPESCG